MFSLRVAILLALSTTQFNSYAVCGYSIDIPFTLTVDEPSEKSGMLLETTSPLPPETTNNPVIENPNVPTLEIVDSPNAIASGQFALLHQNFNISGPGRRGRKTSCICKECNPETGFFIKHFRQYNYYYPHHKVTIPMQYIDNFDSEEPIDDFPVVPSIIMKNNKDTYSSKRSSKPTVRYNKPAGVDSYVPNNYNNYLYNKIVSRIRQSAPVNSRGPGFDPSSMMDNEEPASSSDESSEPIIKQNDETDSSDNQSDDNINEDIINYFSDPDVFGHNRKTVIKNGNRHFKSQQVSISSRTHSQPQPEQVGMTESQAMEGYEQQNRIDMNKINIQTQTLPSSAESQQEDSQQIPDFEPQQQNRIDMNKIDIKTQTLPDSESQQRKEISSSSQSQTFPSGFGPQDRIDINKIDIMSQTLPVLQSQSQQQYKISSSSQSQTLPSGQGSESQEQDSKSSNMQSQSLSNFGPSINLANNPNIDNQNIITVAYNPYFQAKTYGITPMMQFQPAPLSTSNFQNAINWLGASTGKQNVNNPKLSHQSFNPVRTWSNSPSQQSTIYDLSNLSPAYSVII